MILTQKAQQVLSQRMAISQQMINAVSLLNLSSEELQEEVAKEVKRNPALIFKTSSYVSAVGREESDKFQDFLENRQDNSYKTLQAHLLTQAKENINDEYVLSAAEMIIQNLDANGFNYVPIEELFSGGDTEKTITKTEIKKALHAVRRLEPIGCACSGFKQSLIVQAGILCESPKTGHILDIYKNAYGLISQIIKDHYEILSAVPDLELFVQKLAKKNIRITREQAEEIIDLLKSLTPYPGRAYAGASEEKQFITPVAEIKRNGDEFDIIINDEELPALEISPDYKDIASFPAEKKKEARSFLNKAKMFMESLDFRNKTLFTILSQIVHIQRRFFEGVCDKNGERRRGYLKPLMQVDIAALLGLNISTVSRTVNQKYIRCEWGVFEIKDLFSNEVYGGLSKDYVLAQIEEIINGNTAARDGNRTESDGAKIKKLSDEQIKNILKEQGIEISTRTVNKYRAELGIASSYYR